MNDTEPVSQKTLELAERIYTRMLKDKGWDHPDLQEFRKIASSAGISITKGKRAPEFNDIIISGSH